MPLQSTTYPVFLLSLQTIFKFINMQTPQSAYRILALDDHPMVLEGITHLLSANSTCDVRGVTASTDLFALLDEGHCFDLFILDLELPDVDGFEALKGIRQHCPDASILIYTMHEEPWILARLVSLSIQGVVSKNRPVATLVEAVEAIRQGDTYYNDAFTRQLKSLTDDAVRTPMKSSPAFQLSERELQVLRCISQGMTTPEISGRLFLSTNTVGTYRHRLMTKFEAHNVVQLIAKAQRFL